MEFLLWFPPPFPSIGFSLPFRVLSCCSLGHYRTYWQLKTQISYRNVQKVASLRVTHARQNHLICKPPKYNLLLGMEAHRLSSTRRLVQWPLIHLINREKFD